jgi:hypothetical protein
MRMVFIETKLFTSLFPQYLNNEEYRELQNYLMEMPEAGTIIRGSGDIRKLRWAARYGQIGWSTNYLLLG